MIDLTSALPTFLITLREGVEAALVVGIVLACLKKAEQRQLRSWVYAGLGVGLISSALVGIFFSLGIQGLIASYPQYELAIEHLMEGGFSLIAIAFLSWMLVWMTQQARVMKTEIEGSVTAAIQGESEAGWGIFSLILIAVLREGFEAVSLVLAYLRSGLIPAFGAIAGLLGATVIGILIFRLGVKINIRAFFQVMGIFLLLIVAGLVISSLAHFDIVLNSLSQIDGRFSGLCLQGEFANSCLLGPQIWDASNILPHKQFPGILLKVLFGYREKLYALEAVGYVLFLVTVGGMYFRSLKGQPTPPPKSVEASN